LHQAHDHVIHLKKDAQFSVFALYNISRDEILELRHYLNENLSKNFIQVSHFQIIISVLFIKKLEEETLLLHELSKSEHYHSQELIFS